MTLPRYQTYHPAIAACGLLMLSMGGGAAASITDFNNWTLVEDPPNANLSSSVDSATQVTLNSSGAVPAATDIGYQSIDGNTPAASTSGYAFDPTASFSVAVDYDWSYAAAIGNSVIGFGIGEDGAGDQSAGVVLAPSDPNTFVTPTIAYRTTNGDELGLINSPAGTTGSMHVLFDATTREITLGIGSAGANTPFASRTLAAGDVYDLWNTDGDNDLLLVSLFLRSDDSFGPELTSGTTQAIFSNVRVTGGSPVAVPEPSSLALLGIGGLLIARRRRN